MISTGTLLYLVDHYDINWCLSHDLKLKQTNKIIGINLRICEQDTESCFTWNEEEGKKELQTPTCMPSSTPEALWHWDPHIFPGSLIHIILKLRSLFYKIWISLLSQTQLIADIRNRHTFQMYSCISQKV